MNGEMTLAELAEAAGLPARTIRFYISRGVLDGPTKAGRDAAYTAEHLARLNWIKERQSEGRTLSEIARIAGGSGEAGVPVSSWWQYAVADDVVVLVRSDGSPWRLKEIRTAIDDFGQRVKKTGKKEK